MKCPMCDNQLEGRQKYCSAACRKKASRGKEVPENISSSPIGPPPEVVWKGVIEIGRSYGIRVSPDGTQLWRSVTSFNKEGGYWVTPHLDKKYGLCLNPDCTLETTV